MNSTFEAVGLTGIYGVGNHVFASSAKCGWNRVPRGIDARRIRSAAANTIVHPSPSTVV